MTKKHRIYFFFWRLFMRAKGIKIGTLCTIHNKSKNKNIKGVITSLSGNSINKKKYHSSICINWLEPLLGYDSRYYSCGSYGYESFKNKYVKLY